MAILRKSELKKMSSKDLIDKLAGLNKELMKARAQVSSKVSPDNPGKIKEIRRTIARILTIQLQRGEK